MFNIFNIFKTENEVVIELEAKVKALNAELADCRKKLSTVNGSYSNTFGHYINTAKAYASEAVRADNLEKELKALKESDGGN